jgi:hypothetical protein
MSVPVPFIPNIEFELSRHPPPLYKQDMSYNDLTQIINPAKFYGISKYINNIPFCYRLLYYVRNNKINQTPVILTITSEIAKYYKIIYQYYIYFGFEVKKENEVIGDINGLIITVENGVMKTLHELFDVKIQLVRQAREEEKARDEEEKARDEDDAAAAADEDEEKE